MKDYLKIILILAVGVCMNSCNDDSIQPTETYKSYTIKSITLLNAPDKSYITNGIVSDYDNDGSGPDVYCQYLTTEPSGGTVREYTSAVLNNVDLTRDLPLHWVSDLVITNENAGIDFLDKDEGRPEFDHSIGSVVIYGNLLRERSTIINGRSSIVVSDTEYYYQNPPRITTAKFEIQWNK